MSAGQVAVARPPPRSARSCGVASACSPARLTSVARHRLAAQACRTDAANWDLCGAIYSGNVDEACATFTRGADWSDSSQLSGLTPLHKAVFLRDLRMCRALLEQEASVDLVDNSFQTALHVAAMRLSPDVLQLLLRHQASPEVEDREGVTPARMAAAQCRTNSHADDVQRIGVCTDTLARAMEKLILTCRQRLAELTRVSDYGDLEESQDRSYAPSEPGRCFFPSSCSSSSSSGRSAIMRSLRRKNSGDSIGSVSTACPPAREMRQRFSTLGQDSTVMIPFAAAAMASSALERAVQSTQLTLQVGGSTGSSRVPSVASVAPVIAAPRQVSEALVWSSSDLRLPREVLFGRADPNKRYRDDRTPLHFAAEAAQLAIVQLLLQHAADVRCVDVEGLSPLRLAIGGFHARAASASGISPVDPARLSLVVDLLLRVQEKELKSLRKHVFDVNTSSSSPKGKREREKTTVASPTSSIPPASRTSLPSSSRQQAVQRKAEEKAKVRCSMATAKGASATVSTSTSSPRALVSAAAVQALPAAPRVAPPSLPRQRCKPSRVRVILEAAVGPEDLAGVDFPQSSSRGDRPSVSGPCSARVEVATSNDAYVDGIVDVVATGDATVHATHDDDVVGRARTRQVPASAQASSSPIRVPRAAQSALGPALAAEDAAASEERTVSSSVRRFAGIGTCGVGITGA
eukprot:TRINITY_DN25458_c0_g1_i1.p1 TRINITY_DN25458_c0_g1~~TRINITY_DN25458_c0_g1_i1.p1  ORF type:complete len:691 (+),score=128.67 TRINITY_DN25458_c0_g1_i1:25-2097(+)